MYVCTSSEIRAYLEKSREFYVHTYLCRYSFSFVVRTVLHTANIVA